MLCSRCNKRPAMVFITVDQNEAKPQALCLTCAKELGMKPLDDIMGKLGISEEDVDAMAEQMAEFMSAEEDELDANAFPENFYADDFGTMMFLDENDEQIKGLQGCEMFYKANVAGFAESVGIKFDWDPENIADKTEIDIQHSQQQEALGGILKHMLATKKSLDFDNLTFIDLGTLIWSYNSNEGVFYTVIDDGAYYGGDGYTNGKSVCTKYKSATSNPLVDKTIAVGTWSVDNQHSACVIKDNSFDGSVTAFTAAIKGVLLAYEKASS